MDWYAQHRRDLPWRRTADPYRILVAEVMLQQTQVDRVAPFFQAFLVRFPTLAELARAPRAEVIRAWGGLGYNRRAVQLHRLAQEVVERHRGEIPREREALLALPGIGPYTAGAILSIAFGLDEPALDTNVRRVLGRYGHSEPPGPTELEHFARDLVPAGRARDWNQALMDLGSTICTARSPRCLLCPLRPGCRSAGSPSSVTRRLRRSVPFEQTTRYFRGRLLRELRGLQTGRLEPLGHLGERLAARGVAEPPLGWQLVGESLARDGLARIEYTRDGVALGIA